MTATRWPAARWRGDGKSGGSYTGGPWRGVVHTTETVGMPKYSDGATAPHLTYDPKTGRFYQHTSFAVAARALRNQPGGVQTNRRRAVQLEMICYSDKRIADLSPSRLWVGDLTSSNYDDIRGFAYWCEMAFGIGMVWPGKQARSSAEANAPGFRMSPQTWEDYGGWCGHQHIPEQTHWDPGAFDWTEMLTPANEERDGLIAKTSKPELIQDLQALLNDVGIVDPDGNRLVLDGAWGPKTQAAVDSAHARIEWGHTRAGQASISEAAMARLTLLEFEAIGREEYRLHTHVGRATGRVKK